MPVSLADSIEGYAEAVDYVGEYSEPVEVTSLFALRDGIEDDLARGIVIDERLHDLLHDADEQLLAAADDLGRRFPEFDFAASVRHLVGSSQASAAKGRRTA